MASDELVLRGLRPPEDGHGPGWRRVSATHEAHWDGGRWVDTRTLPGVVEPPPWWASALLLGAAGFFALVSSVAMGLAVGLYLLPAIIACLRGTDWWKFNAGAVSLVCILAGWTMVGWVAALVMAVMKDRPPA